MKNFINFLMTYWDFFLWKSIRISGSKVTFIILIGLLIKPWKAETDGLEDYSPLFSRKLPKLANYEFNNNTHMTTVLNRLTLKNIQS